MKKRLLAVLAAALVITTLLSVVSFADFGVSAGDSDWGCDSGSDWGGGSDWDYDYGSDYDSGHIKTKRDTPYATRKPARIG